MARFVHAVSLTLGGWLLTGCPLLFAAGDQLAFECATATDCAEGYLCRDDGFCELGDRGDGNGNGDGDGDEEADGGACADGACSTDGGAVHGDGDGDGDGDEADGGACADGACSTDGGAVHGDGDGDGDGDAGMPPLTDGGDGDAGPGASDAGGVDAGDGDGEPPSLGPTTVLCDEGGPCIIDLAVSDPDTPLGDLTYTLIGPANDGVVTVGPGPGQVTYMPEQDFFGPDMFTLSASDGANVTAPAVIDVTVVRRHSCLTVLQSGVDNGDGVYRVDPDGAGGADGYNAWCDMTTDGGGWTLALKVDGEASTFRYDSVNWTDTSVIGAPDLSELEARLQPYAEVSVSELLVVMTASDNGEAGTPLIVPLPLSAPSLHTIISSDATVRTSLPRSSWLAAAPSGALQDNCNQQGINVRPAQEWEAIHMGARIGIIGNNENECVSGDSRVGVGMYGSVCNGDDDISAGVVAGCGAQPAEVERAAFARVFVRDSAGLLSDWRSCLEARFNGVSTTGITVVDLDGDGAAAPFDVWCDQATAGGGWMMVGRSEQAVIGGMGWGTDRGSPDDDGSPFSLDVRGLGLEVGEVLFGAYSSGKTWSRAYRHRAIPSGYPTGWDSSTFFMPPPATITGDCQVDRDSHMFRFLGRTGRGDVFFMRDNGGNDSYGLERSRWDSAYGDCSRGGDIDDQDGMVMIR